MRNYDRLQTVALIGHRYQYHASQSVCRRFECSAYQDYIVALDEDLSQPPLPVVLAVRPPYLCEDGRCSLHICMCNAFDRIFCKVL